MVPEVSASTEKKFPTTAMVVASSTLFHQTKSKEGKVEKTRQRPEAENFWRTSQRSHEASLGTPAPPRIERQREVLAQRPAFVRKIAGRKTCWQNELAGGNTPAKLQKVHKAPKVRLGLQPYQNCSAFQLSSFLLFSLKSFVQSS